MKCLKVTEIRTCHNFCESRFLKFMKKCKFSKINNDVSQDLIKYDMDVRGIELVFLKNVFIDHKTYLHLHLKLKNQN